MAARSSGTYAEKRRRLTTQSKIPGAGYAPLPTDDEDAIDLPEEHARMPEKLVIHLSAENEVDIPEGPVDHVLQSSTFQALMAGMIMMNALVLGLETDIQDFHYWDLIENLFLLIFAAELGLKFYGQGQKHFFSLGNAEIGWNLFDLVVVGLGVIDFFMSLCFSTSSGSMATLFRIIRLLRIMRLFRIVKFLKQLYLLAFGFVEAIQAMFWVTMLLTVVLYVCSIVMVRTCGRLPHEDPHAEFLHAHFGNIRTSMITLFVLMSSPNLPEYIGQEGLLSERPALLLFLISFIIIGSFGMIALLTGVISESMFEKNQIRAEESRKEQDDLMRKLGTKADEIHDLLDVNEEGEATKEDIAKFAMPLVARLYEEAMVDYTELNLEQLVEVMDTGGDGRINNDEFKRCVTTYAAGVKPLSIQEVHYNTAVCINKIAEINFKLDKVVNSAPPGSPSKTRQCAALRHGHADAGVVTNRGADGSIATCSEKLDSIEAQLHQLAERASRSSAGGSGALLDWRLPVCAGDVGDPSSTGSVDDEGGQGSARIFLGGAQIHDALRELDACVRDCTRRQLSGQQYLETFIREGMADLTEQLQEKFTAASASWRSRPLLGGFHIGERVGSVVDLNVGAGRISKGDMGLVKGPSIGQDPKMISVDFPQLKGANMLPTDISKVTVERTMQASSKLGSARGSNMSANGRSRRGSEASASAKAVRSPGGSALPSPGGRALRTQDGEVLMSPQGRALTNMTSLLLES